MTKFHPYSRRVFRERLRAWSGRNLKLIATTLAGVVALLAVETFLPTRLLPDSAFSWWLLGVARPRSWPRRRRHVFRILAHDREAIWHMRGAWGEENTRTELQRAKRRRVIWDWVDSIALQNGDLDHLVITRQGGLVAIDSKWRNDATDTSHMAQAAHRARLRAEGLTRSLFTSDRSARHRAKAHPLPVLPVIVLWGTAQHSVPEGARVDDIPFVAGRRLLGWLKELDHQPVSRAAARDITRELKRYRAGAWDAN